MIKKSIFFLLTDYDININNNIVVLHPPSKDIINKINDEVLNLNKVIKDFKIHPIPFIYLDKEKNDIDIEWIGIFDNKDKLKLNQFLLEGVLLPKTDFNDLDNIFGNLHFQDKHGNIHSKIPKIGSFLKYYSRYEKIDDILIEDIIIENDCIKEDGLYLCNGNYYQEKFLQLIDVLNNFSDCNEITKLLFEKIEVTTKENIETILNWKPEASDKDIPFKPARVLMQDFTGVPAVVDIASLRAEAARRGKNPDGDQGRSQKDQSKVRSEGCSFVNHGFGYAVFVKSIRSQADHAVIVDQSR